VLTRGPLRLEVHLRPLGITLRRDGRTLLSGLSACVCEGAARDRLIRVTEGVVAREELGFPERPVQADVAFAGEHELDVQLALRGGREAVVRVALVDDAHALLELRAGGDPLRVGLEWDGASGERLAGLGARHTTGVDHAGRRIQLGADRAYTGPDCPPDLLDLGGIPQGDYAPAPWLQSSAGYALWCETDANGTRFDLDGPLRVSTRAAAGPLRVHVFAGPRPVARLRRYLALTGRPALLPEWGYGFWKSRDVYAHQEDAEEDVHGCRWHGIPLDAIVLDSPWETQYNTWRPNPHQFPDFAGMVGRFRRDGVRTVVWVTPWVNLDSRDGQIPPDPGSQRLHAAPASNYAEAHAAGHFVRDADGSAHVGRWWMGRGSIVDFTSNTAEAWWREQAKATLGLGVEGIKADDGEGWYVPEEARLSDGTRGGASAWRLGGLYRRSMQRALDEVHGPGRGVVFGRSGWSGQQATGALWGGDQASDFWSLRALVAAGLSAAHSGFSNWSHDVGGYLGARGVDRCPAELLVRWAQVGCFTPLMQAHGRLVQEPWTYDARTLALYRGYVLLHEMLVPYIRAAAATAARGGPPVWRPLALLDPADDDAWTVGDAFGFGPSLWVAPVLEQGATSRPVRLPRGEWIEAWSGARVRGGRVVEAPAPLHAIPLWVRAGAVVVTHPAAHVARGLGRHARSGAAARRHAVGRAARRPRAGAVGRRNAYRVAARALDRPGGARRRLQKDQARRAVTR